MRPERDSRSGSCPGEQGEDDQARLPTVGGSTAAPSVFVFADDVERDGGEWESAGDPAARDRSRERRNDQQASLAFAGTRFELAMPARESRIIQIREAAASLHPLDYATTLALVAVSAVGTSLDDGPNTAMDFYRAAASVIPTLLVAVAIQGRVLELSSKVNSRANGPCSRSKADLLPDREHRRSQAAGSGRLPERGNLDEAVGQASRLRFVGRERRGNFETHRQPRGSLARRQADRCAGRRPQECRRAPSPVRSPAPHRRPC